MSRIHLLQSVQRQILPTLSTLKLVSTKSNAFRIDRSFNWNRFYCQSTKNESLDTTKLEPQQVSQFLGVQYNSNNIKKWSCSLTVEGKVIDGGSYWTEEDAAKAYDELSRMYLNDAPTNFELDATVPSIIMDDNNIWKRHREMAETSPTIPCRKNEPLSLKDITDYLAAEKAINTHVIDLAGKSSLAEFMVFTTGRSVPHMRKLADTIHGAVHDRELGPKFHFFIDGRDCDDWIAVDANNIIVHIMDEPSRKRLSLEQHWEEMVHDKHPLADLSEDELMEMFPAILEEELEDASIDPDDADTWE